jgi:ubiquitin C-terminal hydrolase
VRASKSIKVKQLPNILIFVLKRFEYDREQGIRKKLNNKFEFPTDEFTVSRQLCETEQPSYRLRGIVVHIGTSDAGHYMSYIKSQHIWYVFDDSRVEPTNVATIKSRCYGSEKGYESAYLVFY